jgi:uncharacterized protein (UPF0332 family)
MPDNTHKEKRVSIRIHKADAAFDDAVFLCDARRYDSSVNRLYYACFYIMNALFLASDLHDAQTHSEVKSLLRRSFLKKSIISVELVNHYNILYDWCQEADYSDYSDFDRETTEALIAKTEAFITEVRGLALRAIG